MTNSIGFSEGDDPRMAQASARARETFKYLWRELSWERRRIVPALDLAVVKLPFEVEEPAPNAPLVEHMWVDEIDFDGFEVSGNLMNAPNWVTSVAEGDRVARPASEIGDWMFAISDRVYGAFTVHALRAGMSDQERASHDAMWGLEFGDPNRPRIVATPTEAHSGWFGRLKARFRREPSAEERALLDHPMSLGAEASLREQLEKSPDLLHQTDERGWTMLHREALAGNRTVVATLVGCGADVAATTPSGHTARDLAAVMAWDETVSVLDGLARS